MGSLLAICIVSFPTSIHFFDLGQPGFCNKGALCKGGRG